MKIFSFGVWARTITIYEEMHARLLIISIVFSTRYIEVPKAVILLPSLSNISQV